MNIAERLKKVRAILETITITTDVAVRELAKEALRLLPDPDAVGECVDRCGR